MKKRGAFVGIDLMEDGVVFSLRIFLPWDHIKSDKKKKQLQGLHGYTRYIQGLLQLEQTEMFHLNSSN